jgi:hypothetical protein
MRGGQGLFLPRRPVDIDFRGYLRYSPTSKIFGFE